MRAKSGFTLVEILIVVVILSILAAIVIPQFTGASTEAKLSSLVSDLQSMRSQIELYKLQHNDQLPTKGDASFEQCMTVATDVGGNVADGTETEYGPYMPKLPTNQFVDLATVDESGTGTIGDGSHGWDFNPNTGDLYPDYVDADRDGVSDSGDDDETTY